MAALPLCSAGTPRTFPTGVLVKSIKCYHLFSVIPVQNIWFGLVMPCFRQAQSKCLNSPNVLVQITHQSICLSPNVPLVQMSQSKCLSPNGHQSKCLSPNGVSLNDPLVQMGVVQMTHQSKRLQSKWGQSSWGQSNWGQSKREWTIWITINSILTVLQFVCSGQTGLCNV